jgi:hypothetical protein
LARPRLARPRLEHRTRHHPLAGLVLRLGSIHAPRPPLGITLGASGPCLNKETNAALADAKMRARLTDLGGTALAGSPADFGKLIAEETEKWSKVIRAANIKAE